jgi:hypothetical protein
VGDELKLHIPVRAIHRNVTFCDDGTVWATFEMPGLPTMYHDDSSRIDIHRRVANALMTAAETGSEFSILGVVAPVDPESIGDAMVEDVDLGLCPHWGDVVDATVAAEADRATWRRRVFLSVKLAEPGGWAMVATALGAAESLLAVDLGMASAPVSAKARGQRAEEAEALARRLTNSLGAPVVPASSDTVIWLHERAWLRRIEDLPAPRIGAQSVSAAQVVALADRVKIFEGGQKGDPGRKGRQYTKVLVDDSDVAYQCAAVISTHPGEWDHPRGQGDWLARLDEIGANGDWCSRVRVPSREQTLARIRRKSREANAQVDEHNTAVGSGLAAAAVGAAQALQDQEEYLKAHPGEWDLSVVTIVSLAADDVAGLAEDFAAVVDHFKSEGYRFDRPLGHQNALLMCMQPGSASHGVLGHFGQSMFCAGLASASPFESGDLLDPGGILIADRWDGAQCCGPLFHDPGWGPRHNRGSSIAAIGDQGGGKSYFGKQVTYGTLARGGKATALDRTAMEEYVRFARAIPRLLPGVVAQVVRFDDPAVCVDPLRIFTRDVDSGADLRRKYCRGLAAVMLKVKTMSEEGMALDRAVDWVLARANPAMPAVLAALQSVASVQGDNTVSRQAAATVAAKLAALAADPLGRLLFGDGVPLDLGRADYIVFAARHLEPPTDDELSNQHLYDELPPEKILAQGLLYLVTAIAREFAFNDDNRMCVCTFDEVWSLINTPKGFALLDDIIRNGRKHKVSVIVLSQDGVDVARLKGIAYWFIFLLLDADAARRAISQAGLAATDELVNTLTSPEEMGNGICLVRDLRRRAGRCKIRAALTAELSEALETNSDRIAEIDAGRPRDIARRIPDHPGAGRPVPIAAGRPSRVPLVAATDGVATVRPSKRRAAG